MYLRLARRQVLSGRFIIGLQKIKIAALVCLLNMLEVELAIAPRELDAWRLPGGAALC